ncbi:MAG: FMN-binding negative transcriptional regulator [Rhodocyclaceae bacterium]|nr:FMN-binding negative transcriptional regulator [Rhodocyclaceae bacterium]
MYIPASFREEDTETLHALIHTHPLGTLVTHGAAGLQASPLPFLLDANRGAHGTLRAHMARANPHWRALAGEQCLVIFQGPDAYVTPDWYPSKQTTHKVVPTWNYATVHARGAIRVVDDPDWLARQIADLTAVHEARRARPWSPADAPADFIAAQRQAVIGLEIVIAQIEGKWKMSQNKDAADRQGVVDGLRDPADPHANLAVAALMENRKSP